MKLTKRSIEALQSEKGGYSRSVVEALGISWPPVEGRKDALCAAGKEIPDAEYAKLIALKNAHLKKKKDQTPTLGFE